MVKLTMDLIAKGSSGVVTDGRGTAPTFSPKGGTGSQSSEQTYLRKLTHLYLQDKNIEEITGLSACKNLLVLYLYDNKLTTVPYLGFAKCLTHLYLQNNSIDRMENLKDLKSLVKLYVGGNRIVVVEGIENCENLKELHVEHQRLPPGEKIVFDPRSVRGISGSLEVLNISGVRMESLSELPCLRRLRHLMANENFLESVNEVVDVVRGFERLEKLELLGNPCVAKSRYRERLVNACPALDVLDGKEITMTMRRFMTSLASRRREVSNAAKQMNSESRDETPLADGERDKSGGGDAPPPGSVVPSYVMPRLPHRRFEEVLARSQTMPSTDGEGDKGARGRSGAPSSANKRVSVVNYVGPGASAFMADPNDDRLRTSMALKAAYEAATELHQDQKSLYVGGGGGTFMGALRGTPNGGASGGHR